MNAEQEEHIEMGKGKPAADHESFSKNEGKNPCLSQNEEEPRSQEGPKFVTIRPHIFRCNEPVVLGLEMLQSKFHMTRAEAAKSLHISETALKQACRKLGITSWPRQAARRQVQTVADDAATSAKIIDSNSRARSATPSSRADSVCARRQELMRERGGGFLVRSSSFPSNSECSQEMSSVFQQSQEEEEENSQLRQRRLLNDKRPGHASSNMPVASSNMPVATSPRVSFAEELVGACFGSTGTNTRN